MDNIFHIQGKKKKEGSKEKRNKLGEEGRKGELMSEFNIYIKRIEIGSDCTYRIVVL